MAKSAAPVPAPLAPRFTKYGLPRRPGQRCYWLVKTEPESFSFDDLMKAPAKTTHWDGIRNFQARNFLRDHMRVGDEVLVYHSNAEPPAAVGIARVVREAYPDHTAFDPKHEHYDPKSDPASPTWVMVDLQAVRRLAVPVTLPIMRATKALAGMELLQKGSRLSITPLSAAEWEQVLALGVKR